MSWRPNSRQGHQRELSPSPSWEGLCAFILSISVQLMWLSWIPGSIRPGQKVRFQSPSEENPARASPKEDSYSCGQLQHFRLLSKKQSSKSQMNSMLLLSSQSSLIRWLLWWGHHSILGCICHPAMTSSMPLFTLVASTSLQTLQTEFQTRILPHPT